MPSTLTPTEACRRDREALRQAEIALKEQREAVAALRRELPPGPLLPDYTLHEGPCDLAAGDSPVDAVKLSSLLPPFRHLVVIHFMYGGAQATPCPMCTMWADGYNAVVEHIQQRANVVLVAKGELAELRALARQRDWTNLRLLSSAGTSFNADFAMEDDDGNQMPGVSIVEQTDDGLRLSYTGCAMMGDGHYRGLDMLSPVWNILDLMPAGRGDWMPAMSYA